MSRNPFRYFKTSPEIIRLAVMLYVRFPLSLGIVRINARRQRWTKNVERLCGTELVPFRKRGGTVQLEIFAAVKMAFLIEMIVYG